jgi:hypothetical protein
VDLPIFREALDEMYGYFSRKPLTEGQERVYWQAVREYSDTVWRETVSRFLRAVRPAQNNFPCAQDLVALCDQYLESHPEQKPEKVQEHFCSECAGRGYLESYHGDDPLQYISIVRCGHCENWKRRFSKAVPIRRRSELEVLGRVITMQRVTREDWETTIPVSQARIIGVVAEVLDEPEAEVAIGMKEPVRRERYQEEDIPF